MRSRDGGWRVERGVIAVAVVDGMVPVGVYVYVDGWLRGFFEVVVVVVG